MKLLAGLNLLFFITFLIVLAMATGRAHADTTACSGADLMEAPQELIQFLGRAQTGRCRAQQQGRSVEAGEAGAQHPLSVPEPFITGDPRVVTRAARRRRTTYDAAATVVIRNHGCARSDRDGVCPKSLD